MIEEVPRKINMFDLDALEDEVTLVPNIDFEVIQLGNNPYQSMKIGSRLPFKVKYTLM